MRRTRRAVEILRTQGAIALLSSISAFIGRQLEPALLLLANRLTTWDIVSFRDKWTDAATLSDTDSPVIIDAGAAIESEDSVGSLLEAFDSPTIIAFEPRPEKALELAEKYKETSVVVHEFAVGDTVDTININLSGGSSSVLLPTSGKIEVESTITVDQVRLDDFLDASPDVLKLDLQGYELQALEGAADLLPDVKVVITEINFQPLYRESATFNDIDKFLQERGFKLFNIYDIHTWPSGDLVWGDAVYVRDTE